MKENTNRIDKNNRHQDASNERSNKESSHEVVKGNPVHQGGSAEVSGSSSMDEKSSGIGRREKGTGLATKDGVTGSDYDGQVTE